MKAILYFVAAGFVSDVHKEAAKTIAEKTNKKVVFRNSTSATASGENPEPNEGVAGLVPNTYSAFSRYDDEGKETKGLESLDQSEELHNRPLNAIGLPDGDGCPEDRDALKAALDSEGIAYHANFRTEKLVDLYLAHFYPTGPDTNEPEA